MTTATTSVTSSMESFAQLFEESLSQKEMRVGEIITAEIIRIDFNFVVVNAGLKSESYIPIEEFKNDRGEIEAKVGSLSVLPLKHWKMVMEKPGYHEIKPSA